MAYALGLVTVFFTAFYSWRLLIMTFHGKPRADAHTMEHVHESPWSMLGPLIPLALGAIFAGWYAYGWFAGDEEGKFWNGAIFVLAQPDPVIAAQHIDEFYKELPSIAGVLG